MLPVALRGLLRECASRKIVSGILVFAQAEMMKVPAKGAAMAETMAAEVQGPR